MEDLPIHGSPDQAVNEMLNEWLDDVYDETDVEQAVVVNSEEVRSGKWWRLVDVQGKNGHRYVMVYPLN